MVRLLVLDIDGTLLDPSDIVTPIVHDAIAAARERGVEVALATGRRLRSTLPIVQELGIRLPLVIYNGALVWSTEDKGPIHEAAFSREMLEAIIHRAAPAGLAPVLLPGPAQSERVVVPNSSAPQPYVDAFDRPQKYQIDRIPIDQMPEIPGVLTVDLFGPDADLRAVTAELAAIGISVFHTGPFDWVADPSQWVGAANLHMPGVSKASGVALLAQDLGITMREVVAIGDGENDLPLLVAAGVGVAMGNAPAHVQARADVVVRGHDEDGVAEAIERFVLANC